MKLSLPTRAQVAASGRHVISYAAGAVTVAVGLHFVSADQGNQIGAAITGIVNGVESIVGGLATLVSIGGAVYAAWTASASSQAAAIGANDKTEVTPMPNGGAVVTIKDPAMASAALGANKKSS